MNNQEKSIVSVSFVDHKVDSVVKKVVYVKEGCRFFFNAQHLLLKLSRGERALYDFLCEEMDEKNRVIIDDPTCQKFVAQIKTITSSTLIFSPGSVRSFRKKLLSLGLLLHKGSQNSAYYQVNPKYAFNGPEYSRTKLLKDIITKRLDAKLDISPLLPVSVDRFINKPSVVTGTIPKTPDAG